MLCQLTPSYQEVYSYIEGRDEVVKRISQYTHKPVVVAVFGVPDSGKTHLIDFIGEHFEGQGLQTRQRNNKEGINLYESWVEYGHSTNIDRIAQELMSYDVVLYHCPWDNRAKPWEHRTDPEESVRKSIGRSLDLSVGIFNPKRSPLPTGSFDLVISNPSSLEKPVYLDD